MTTKQILLQHNLKRTSCREQIISLLLESPHALSEDDIKTKLGSLYDRTTLYRTFKTLVDNHIIHKIVVDSSLVTYAIDTLQAETHAHFYCNTCNAVVCIPSEPIPGTIPHGFAIDETSVLYKGTCKHCAQN